MRRLLLGLSVFCSAHICAQEKGDVPLPLRLAAEASTATLHNLRSGKGTGVYEHFRQKVNEPRPVVIEKALVTAFFDRGKYHLRLDYDRTVRKSYIRRVIVCDGSAIFSSLSFDGPHPTGTEGEITPIVAGNKKPKYAGFPWDLSRLIVVDVEGFLKHVSLPSIKVVRMPSEGYRIKFNDDLFSFDIDENSGFNVSKSEGFRKDQAIPVSLRRASWKKAAGTWFVESFTEQMDVRFRGGPMEQFELRYEQFEPNCDIRSDLFSLDALELKEGSRIVDQRPETGQKEYYYSKKASGPEELDNLVAQVEKLPYRSHARKTQGGRQWLVWLAMGASILLIVLGVLLFARRLMRRQQ